MSAQLGRTLSRQDDLQSNAVISHGLWQRRFGSSPDVLGQALEVEGRAWTIVGVMAPNFDVPNASLMIQSVANLQRRPLGFAPARLLSIPLTLADASGGASGPTERVAAGSGLPFSGQNSGNTFEIEGGARPSAAGYRLSRRDDRLLRYSRHPHHLRAFL